MPYTQPLGADDFYDLLHKYHKYDTFFKTVRICIKDKTLAANDGKSLVVAPFHDFEYTIVHGEDGDYLQVNGPFSFQIRFYDIARL